MDSVNLPEAQSTPLNCRNTACNTNPVACTCWSSKDYVQTFPQAYCFTPLQSGMPRCKHLQESYEENFSIQQPFFPRFPFYPSFFHKSAFSPNFCCAHNRCDDTSKQHIHTSEHENTRTGCPYESCSQEKNDFRDHKTIGDEDAQKQNHLLGPEFPLLWFPFNMPNATDSQINSFFQRCACGDSISWTCNPFIAPIVSYCLFWNSQKPNVNGLPTNYNVNKPENLCHSNSENAVNQNFLNPDNKKEKFSNNLDLAEGTKCIATETKNSPEENSFEVDQQMENTDQKSGNSSSFLSLNSFNYPEDNSLKNLEKEEDENSTKEVETCMRDEDSETEEFDSDQEESDEGLKSDKKVLSNNNSNVYLSLDYNENLKDNECLSPTGSQSLTNLKTRKNSTHSMDILTSENRASDILGEGESTSQFFKDSDDENGITASLNQNSDIKSQTCFKKFIKNFTMTDQANSVLLSESQTSVAAAGDLGGVNSDGYKVDIKDFEKNQEETTWKDTQVVENSESTKIIEKDLENEEENKLMSFPEKNTNENLKSGKNAKTGIAKLSHNLKSKDSKTDSVKQIQTKQSKVLSLRDFVTTKRKHSCFPNDNAADFADKSIKIQKTRNCAVIQQQSSGPEKQHKETNVKNQLAKKEEKMLPAKVRQVSTTQKTVKCSIKK